uniref:Uncharacterized protein n=1 Tax=Arundo donax TaxID=35708 RepID=A0A0A9FYJ3_ARUDO
MHKPGIGIRSSVHHKPSTTDPL